MLLSKRLAGTMSRYSKRAIPQLTKTIPNKVVCLIKLRSLNRKCPYQAMFIKELEAIKGKIVLTEREIISQCIFGII
jgi:hypothetical protein